MIDDYDLARFVSAQSGIYDQALQELVAGRKRTHWMWFVFPQIAGLGSSPMARRYAISSLGEAKAYLNHPLLGSRLKACTDAVVNVSNTTAHKIFGSPDDMKFHSSMTLFARANPAALDFVYASKIFFDGRNDNRTKVILDEIR